MLDRRTERELLIACVLGDGCIVQHKQQGTFWFKLTHSPAQRDYLLWKCNLLESTRLVRGRHFTVREKVNKHTNGKSYPSCTANMYGLKYFRILRKWVYPAGQKSWSRVMKYLRSPMSLAILFMDDGCAEHRRRKHRDGSMYFLAPRMSLAVFRPEQECLDVLTWLATTFGVQGYIERRMNSRGETSCMLRFNVENSHVVWNAIAPFVQQLPSMRKKFDLCIEMWGWPASATGVARAPGDSV